VDGDTLHCSGGRRIRLYGIDAPEMPGHCRDGRACTPGDPFAAQAQLRGLIRGAVTCRTVETDRHGRSVARCESAGRDLSCFMLASGHAVRRHGVIWC
jgi:endonuclease YncB( thermonuclease family)